MTFLQKVPFLREQRQFPNDDLRELANQSDHAYIDIAQKVNSREISIYATNFQVISGQSWYLAGGNQRQQALRQLYQFWGITAATQANPAVLTIPNNKFIIGQSITIYNVGGMTQLNGNTYTIIAISGNLVTINVDSTGFGAYTSGGQAINPHNINWASIAFISPRSYGTFTDGTNWYGAIYASSTAIVGQVSFYVTPTNIVVLTGAGAPAITSGFINLEWVSQV